MPSVREGNHTLLGEARLPFACYLIQVHNRIHPIFADQFLPSLVGQLPSTPTDAGPEDMFVALEIVLEGQEGGVARMGVVKTSGATDFDLGALESVSRAAPFGPPPPETVSPDGNVYLHWQFRRDPQYACSTFFAHPYKLKSAPGVSAR